MSINGLRRTNNREKGRLRWSLRTEGISGRTGTIIVDLEEVLQSTLDQLLLK